MVSNGERVDKALEKIISAASLPGFEEQGHLKALAEYIRAEGPGELQMERFAALLTIVGELYLEVPSLAALSFGRFQAVIKAKMQAQQQSNVTH